MQFGLWQWAAALALAGTPACGAPRDASARSDRALGSAADRLIRQRMAETRTPGVAIVVVRDGKLALLRGYGSADLARRIPVDPRRTVFRIGSVTKLFTYTLVMQLAEQGQLDLDRDLNDYLSAGTIPATFKSPITARAVMAHRTGFEDAVMYRLLRPDGAMPSAERFVHDNVPTRVRPAGVATSYSNFAVSALGQATARITGIAYPELVRHRILVPLGMADTTVAEPPVVGRAQPFGAMAPRLARWMSIGYASGDGGVRPVAYEHIYPAAAPAGAMSSTAADMARFMAAYLNDGRLGNARILRPETVVAMRRRSYPDRPGAPDFAGGWTNGPIAGHPAYWHSGAVNGFRAFLTVIPDLRMGVFIAANSDAWGTRPDLVRTLVAEVAGAATSALPTPAAIRAADYVGEYLTSRRSYSRLETLLALDAVARVGDAGAGRLRIATPDGDAIWLPVDRQVFRPEAGEDRIAFDRDASGRAIRFYATNGLRFYERIGWAQRPVVLYFALVAAAVAALAAATSVSRLDPGRRWPGAMIALAGLMLPLAFLIACGTIGDANAETWPGLPLRLLVASGYLALAVVPVAVVAAIVARPRPVKIAFVAQASTLALATWLLTRWGLFGGAFN